MIYTRDVPRNDKKALEGETAHVIAHLSAVASEDDDSETNADDVRVVVVSHPDNPDLIRIVGTLDAEPKAPYLEPDYDAFAGIDPALMRAAGL